MTETKPFWETKSLTDMSREEWESLCDGCAKCCVVVLQDENTERYHRTKIACKLLDVKALKCRQYGTRTLHVPGCVPLTPENIAQLHWMPSSCAYRRLSEGKGLADWHPLVTGDPNSTHTHGHSVARPLVSELHVAEEDYEDHIIEEGD